MSVGRLYVSCCLCGLLLASGKIAFAQVSEDGAFEILNAHHGLPSNSAWHIKQDDQGFIWLYTLAGLSRFDGYSFNNYSKNKGDTSLMAGYVVADLYRNKDEFWIGFENANIVKKVHDKLTTITGERSGLPNNGIKKIFKTKDRQLWVSVYKNGLYKFDSAETKFNKELDLNDILPAYKARGTFEVYNSIYDIYEDAIGSLWFATHDGLYHYNPATKILKSVREIPILKIPTEERNDLFNHIIPSDSGLWLSSWGGGIRFYHFTKKKWSHFEFENGNAEFDNIVSDFVFFDGKFWYCSPRTGFGEFDPYKKKFKTIYACSANNVMVDHSGIVWCTFIGGVLKYRNQVGFTFTKFSSNTLRISTDIVVDSLLNTTYIATSGADGNGLHVVSPEGREEILSSHTNPGTADIQYINQLLDHNKDSLIIATRRDIFVLNKQTRILTKLNIATPSRVTRISSFRGSLLIATRNHGLFKFDYKNAKVTQFIKSGVESNLVFQLIIDDTRVWLVNSNSVSIYYPETNKLEKIELDLPNPYQINGISINNKLNALYVATENHGLFQCRLSDFSLLKTWTTEDNLPSNTISCVEIDPLGNIWFTNPLFTSCLTTKQQIINFETPLKSDFTFSLRPAQTSKMFVLGYGGYYEMNESLNISNSKPKVVIESLVAGQTKISLADDYLNKFTSITLPDHINSFSVDLFLNDYYNSFQNIFISKLDGFNDIVHTSNRNYISYDNLPAGKYILTVEAKTARGISASNKIQLEIQVTSPFYKTAYFRYIVLLIIILLVYILYTLRIRHIRSQYFLTRKIRESELTALRAQLSPHFIFNTLNSINNYVLKSKIEAASSYLVQFSRLMRKVLENSSRQMISLEEEIEALKIYLQLELLRFDYRFSYAIEVEETINTEEIQIPSLTLQPFFENAIWHGMANLKEQGKLSMYIKKSNGSIVFTIEDNGIGRNAAKQKKSNIFGKKSMGINIIQRRLEILKAEYHQQTSLLYQDILDTNGLVRGTRVILKIPEIVNQTKGHLGVD